jgi:hypothetical protein
MALSLATVSFVKHNFLFVDFCFIFSSFGLLGVGHADTNIFTYWIPGETGESAEA